MFEQVDAERGTLVGTGASSTSLVQARAAGGQSPGGSVAGKLRTQVICGGIEAIDGIRDSWNVLCDNAEAEPFYRPEWIAAYVRAFKPASELVLLTAYSEERLIGILAMVRTRAWYCGVPLTSLAGAANVHCVHFDALVTRSTASEAIVEELWNAIKRIPNWQILQLPIWTEHSHCEELLRCARRDGYRCVVYPHANGPILRMKTDADGRLLFTASTSRHFRHELRRYKRRLKEETGCDAVVSRSNDASADTLRSFYALEAAGWKGESGSAINSAPATRQFYDEIARQGASHGYFCLHSLRAGSELAAGAFSVYTRRCFYPLKIAYRESLHRCAPGHLLFEGILADCAERRIPNVHFGGEQDRFKTEWTQETLPHYSAFIFNSSLKARIAYHLHTQVFSRVKQWRDAAAAVRGRLQHARTQQQAS